MAMYYNGKKVRNLYYNGKCITRLALGKEMTRLVEGDDFVRAEWLRAEMPLNKLLMALPINSNNVDYYIKRLSLGNITILITNGYKYFFWNNAYEIGSFGNGADVEHHPYSRDTQLFHIVTNSTNVLINGIQFNSVGFPIRSINFITEPNGNEGVTLTSSIYVDGVERYIPCRLLRPIPASLDANGIARNAGECGMYDSISGKFYGNVGSGTFTVSDD